MMLKKISGFVSSIFPDDINTDDIIPAWTLQESTDKAFFQKYAFSNYDSGFIKRCSKHKRNIIIAGANFGCGSSREQAIYAINQNNVIAVIASSFPDIFYRNALNNGLILITLRNTKIFKIHQKININLENKSIELDGKKYNFLLSDSDLRTFAHGGKIARIKKHLTTILKENKKNNLSFSSKQESSNPQTMVEKILSNHLQKNVFSEEKIEQVPIDVLFFNEVIGPPAIKFLKDNFSKTFLHFRKKYCVYDPKKIFFIPDHTVPSSSVSVSEGITLMERFAKTQSIKCYKEGDGIEHVVLIEDGYIAPGTIILGTDSHTDTNGALNSLAIGVGTTDASFALATGFLYDFIVPKSIRINLKGKFSKGVFSKDLILYLIGKLGVDGAVKCVIEFGGEALKNISMDGRTTIANMAVEMGARTAILEYDTVLEKYLKGRVKYKYQSIFPDKGCKYEKILDIDLSTLEPCIAFPHKPSNVTFVSKIKKYMKESQKSRSSDFASVKSLKITDAFLGACTNGRYEDFLSAAKIIKGRKVHKDVNFVVIPASRKVYLQLLKNGILDIFARAGANIESSNCGPCFGKHMGVIGKNAQMISSSNRNYIGRMGSKDAKIFLASPITVTAAAINGQIIDPRKYLKD